jgi:hypothetical protein
MKTPDYNRQQTTPRERCKATTQVRLGQVVRCEDYRGHKSAHYNGEHWWSNQNGFPSHHKPISAVGVIIIMTIALSVLLGSLVLFLIYVKP